MIFTTTYPDILQRIDEIDPVAYGKSRNFIDGAVTKLSPYISRGVISLPMVKEVILKKYKRYQSEKLLQELAWREYWQRVWEEKDDLIFSDLKQEQEFVHTHQMPSAIMHAATQIEAIDHSIRDLYQTGYMHNHCRMYVASIICNIAKCHWLQPSQWMYYYLLDGDLASNSLSWQWVAGTFSSKKYYCNQENINRYCYTNQRDTFLDQGYDVFPALGIPDILNQTEPFTLTTKLPVTPPPTIDRQIPTLVYNSYNLDPLWHNDIKANRILLLEPSHYQKYPVSDKVMNFIIALSNNISDIQIYSGDFNSLLSYTAESKIMYKKHPTTSHYAGASECCDYLFPQVSGYFPSFFSYWKKCQKFID